MVDTTDNRGPNMKHIMKEIQNTLRNDMMSWSELADRVLELEDKLAAVVERTQEWHEIADLRNVEIQQLESQLAASNEFGRVMLFERDAAIEVIRKHFGYLVVGQTLKKARAALAQVKGG